MKFNIPKNVRYIIDKLEKNGYEAFVVGGCVRDSMLGIEPKDWDITTSAKPEEIKNCFDGYQLISIGEQHGTVGVIINNENYEITTYRIDGDYSDNRHPEEVTFTDNIELDLSRRDFTVNAMAYNDKRGLVDPFNGATDVKYKALRCVGDADTRFSEDALRILRALRFASVYNFSIENKTSASILKNRAGLSKIAFERISTEFTKFLCGDNVNFLLRRYKDVIAVFLPEIVATFGCEQNTPHHNRTVWKHTTAAVAAIEPDPLLRTVMLLHDIGKPLARRTDSKGRDHFKGHNHFSAVLAKNLLERLKLPTKFIDDAITLIEYHDVRFTDNKKQIKHVLNSIGENSFRNLIKIQYADIAAQTRYKREIKLYNMKLCEKSFEEIVQNNECYSLKDLNINGSDLIHLGITDGKKIGHILQLLLDSVIEEEIANESVILRKRALEIYNTEK
ncbi:MAG: HD domain-containing protein [Ruminococcus sp.]|nr:HD domain-containing protein [Ruminococcus sp.]